MHQRAGVEYRHLAAEFERFAHIVGDEHNGFTQPLLQIEQLLLQFGANQRIERGKRLVHQQNIGVGRQRAREADALAHAAGERIGIAFFMAAQAHFVEPIACLLVLRGHRQATHAQGVFGVLQHG